MPGILSGRRERSDQMGDPNKNKTKSETPTPEESKKPKKEKDPNKPKKEKLPRLIIRLTDADKNTLRFTAKQKSSGAAISFATHTVRDEEGKPSTTRGASANHLSFDDAKSAVDAGASAAVKMGWIPRGGSKTTSRNDVFDLSSLPAPKK